MRNYFLQGPPSGSAAVVFLPMDNRFETNRLVPNLSTYCNHRVPLPSLLAATQRAASRSSVSLKSCMTVSALLSAFACARAAAASNESNGAASNESNCECSCTDLTQMHRQRMGCARRCRCSSQLERPRARCCRGRGLRDAQSHHGWAQVSLTRADRIRPAPLVLMIGPARVEAPLPPMHARSTMALAQVRPPDRLHPRRRRGLLRLSGRWH